MTNPMSPVRVNLGERSYDIAFYFRHADEMAIDIKKFCPERAFVITNDTIWALHGEKFKAAMTGAGIDAVVVAIGDGEKFKNLDVVSKMYDTLIEEHFSRRACVIAFGGGVVGDLAGFVAATFLRGVNFVQVPTTVVAMVDSSVGGKTGVDHPLGKNLIGAFHQPKLVAADLAYLDTLDDHNRRGGFAEIIKYGVIRDAALFEYLEQNIDRAIALEMEPLRHVVARSCEIKAEVVGEDEFEGGVRAHLNYGHTFGHAIETVGNYAEKQFHGQAVAIGMVAAAELAVRRGMLSREDRDRIERLIVRAGLPNRIPEGMDLEKILDRMKSDKKVLDGKIRFILPRKIGAVEMVGDVEPAQVLEVLKCLQ